MIGPALIVVVLLFVLPISVLVGGAFMAMGLGWLVKTDVDQAHPDSELLDLNI